MTKKEREDLMLQFITILTLSTALSVAAYKIQNNEIKTNKNLVHPTMKSAQSSTTSSD